MVTEDKGAPVFTIVGDTYDQCRQKLYSEFGEDYEITNRRTTLKPGFLGLFQREKVEVSYIVKRRGAGTYGSVKTASASTEEEDWDRNKVELLRSVGKSVASIQQAERLDRRIDKLEENLVQKLQQMTAGSDKHPNIAKIEELLERNEFSFGYINRISERIKSEFSLDELDNFEFLQQQVVDWIGESIAVAPERAYRPPHVIVVVGPTGVGKTTTIAKLAANLMLDAKKKSQNKPEIRIITIDRTRVGAMEQIDRYGEIMGVRVDKAESADDVRVIYEDCKNNVDYILIDTSGYSPNDGAHIGTMKTILDVKDMHPDVYLAVCASTKARDLENIMQNYEPFAFRSVIVTKCDETNLYGNVISALYDKHKMVSYITDGQRVPHNIRRAGVIDFLIRLSDFTIDRVHIDDKFGAK